MKTALLIVLAFAPLALHAQDVPAPQAAPPVADKASAPATTTEARPLPSVDELLKQVEANEKRDDKLLGQYTYHQHIVEDSFDGKDDVKKTETTDSEIIPIQGVRVQRVVARNGKPLTPDEVKKESADFDKKVASAKKRKAKEQKDDDKDKLSTARMLELGDLSNERRETINGRPAIAFDYVGKHDKKQDTNGLDAIFQDLAGTVWVDEEDKVIARFDGHFDQDFKLGWGLIVDIHKGVSFTYEETKINSEIWLPKHINARGKASLFVVLFRVHGETTVDFSNYRKYRTDTKLLPDVEVVEDPKDAAKP